ncbi:MFS transporter [Leptolyngbya sp. FACHB-36]|uniref:MFS transporter n=1 Tax=Leptolyngbya sp. FACHB-36 TaxID=2692808 RepID=UPI001681BAA6|nr:MFS transporter [Leptolyngbya sp. FACHB-36]
MGIALAFYAFIAIGIAEGGLGVLIPSIQSTYDLTPASITLLFVSQIAGYVVAALTSSLISSRIGLVRMLLVAAIVLTSALLTYALAPFWWVMVTAGAFLGLGIGLIDAGTNTEIARDRRNANNMGLLHAFYGIGGLSGPAVATTLLAMQMNWRSVYFVFAAVVGLLIVGLLRSGVFGKPDLPQAESGPSAPESLRVALSTPTVLLAGLLLLIYVGTEASMGNWAYSVQAIGRGTPTTIAGYSISAYWLGLTVSRLVTGQVVRRLGAIRTLNIATLLLLVSLVIWWQSPNPLLSLPLVGVALGPIFPLTIWLMPQRVPAAIVPAAIGFVTSVGSLGAASIPTAIGWIATRFSLGVIPLTLLPLAALILVLHRWLARHSSKQGQQE